MDDKLYKSEIDFIFRQFPSYQKVGKIAYKEGLEGMTDFDKTLGSPHKKFPVIHIAGTNGKGSVSHMLAAVLQKCGAKTGLYTSPHLVDFRERIKINGEMISREKTLDFLLKWKSYILEKKPSFFEITTAMAFDHFAKEKVDIAVIETGLGGRLDSTNIVTPMLSIITNIALDHCEQLGFTLGDIAREKAGIIKPNVPVVVGEALHSTAEIFLRKAEDGNSPVVFAQKSLFREVLASDYQLDLKGDYQTHNIRTVLTALSVLGENRRFLDIAGEQWSDSTIREALKTAAAATGLRGRWETLNRNPLIICDTGHNANGLKIVFSQLRRQNFKRLFIALGFVADKDLNSIIGLLPQNAYYFFTQARIERALAAGELAKRAFSLGYKGEIVSEIPEVFTKYREMSGEGDLLFIGGSTYVVAEALEFFEKNPDFFAN
ncbi:MAG: Mur ligase family protein [Bacteroidales bacterium]|nr:Mur ligase family protein [Bacteroidales bacterium]MDD2424984.1 Mur ligase family protein [Bacteroidales bacterium]MDD3989217.1 Mur ligase family protein [Bacteroidales bacterium]